MKKETKVQLFIIVVLAIIFGILVVITIKEMNQNNPSKMYDRDDIRQEFGHPDEEKTEKETTANDVDAGQEVTRKRY